MTRETIQKEIDRLDSTIAHFEAKQMSDIMQAFIDHLKADRHTLQMKLSD